MNKKITIAIIAFIGVVVVSTGVYFALKKPTPVGLQNNKPVSQNGKCGDGICDAKEKANPNLCSQDCTQSAASSNGSKPSVSTGNKINVADPDSPFGVTVGESSYQNYQEFSNLGVKYARLSEKVGAWQIVEPQPGQFQWNYDDAIRNFNNSGIKPVINIKALSNWANPPVGNKKYGLPKDLNAYSNFVKKLVERYDGDGIDDAPGSPKVEYWQIDNEVDAKFMAWDDTPENYAILVDTSYKAIKEANPDAQVVLSGVQNPSNFSTGYFSTVLEKTNSFDIFDVHIYGLKDQYENHMFEDLSLSDYLAQIRQKIGNKPIWATEVATFVGSMKNKNDGSTVNQTEKDQATELLKRYVYYKKSGIDIIFWSNWRIGNANDWIKRGGNPMLSYYTFEKTIEILEGSDWKNIQKIQESDDIYIYKFTKNNKSIWVAWNDNPDQKQVTISNITSQQIKLTEAVPKYDSGSQVTDYNSAFNAATKTVTGGAVNIAVGISPVFVEE